jgi:hypothetical protein
MSIQLHIITKMHTCIKGRDREFKACPMLHTIQPDFSRNEGQPVARSFRLHMVWGRAQPLWVLCTQSFLAFMKEVVFRI